MALVEHLLKTLKKIFVPSPPLSRRKRSVHRKHKTSRSSGSRSSKQGKSRPPKKAVTRKTAKKAVRSTASGQRKTVVAGAKKTVVKDRGKRASSGSKKTGSEPQKAKKRSRPAKAVVKSVARVKATGQKKPLKKRSEPEAAGVLVGDVTHYFGKIGVCVLSVTGKGLVINDRIHIRGVSTDLKQTVRSMQVDSLDVKVARKGQLVGLKVDKIVKVGDKVYKI